MLKKTLSAIMYSLFLLENSLNCDIKICNYVFHSVSETSLL